MHDTDTKYHDQRLLIPRPVTLGLSPLSSLFQSTLRITTLTRIFLAVSALLLVGCSSTQHAQPRLVERDPTQDGVMVVATLPILADLVRNVGGSLVKVSTVVPAGADAHSYQSSPSDSVMISHADLLITNGSGLDDFLLPVLESARADHSVHVVASDGLDSTPQGGKGDRHSSTPHGEEGDPHFWHDPSLAVRYVDAILGGLIQSDPNNAKRYQEQAGIYTARLQKLDGEIATILDQVPPERRILVTHHKAFSHLAQRYGWQSMALTAGDASPVTPEAILLVSQTVKDAGLASVFVEPSLNASALNQIALDSGIQVSPIFAGLGRQVNSYEELMRLNAKKLSDNLR